MTNLSRMKTPTRHRTWVERSAKTLSAIALVLAGSILFPLPSLDAARALAMPQGNWPWATDSVFALGTTSFFLSAFFVDIFRRIAPARLGNAEPFRLAKPVVIVALLLAAIFAYHVVRSVNAVVPLSAETKAIWLVMLVGGQGALAALAWWISKRGIGQGFAIFGALGIASELHDLVSNINGKAEPRLSFGDSAEMISAPLIMAIFTAWVLHIRGSNAALESRIARAPVSGIGPVVLAFGLPMLVTALALFGIVDARAAAAMTPGKPTFTVVASLFTIVMALALGYMNHSFVFRAPDARLRAAFWSSLPATLLFVLVFVWRPALVHRSVVDPLNVVIATAVCMDLWAELSARAKHGELVVITRATDVALADLEASKLRRANLAVLERGVFFSTMTRFFGLLVPIEIMVPADRANEARSVVHS